MSEKQQTSKQGKLKRDKATGRFVKGTSGNPGGMSKGLRKMAMKIKEDYYAAFEEIGGRPAFIKWIKRSLSNKEKFYEMILKVLPKEIIGEGFSDTIQINIIRPAKKEEDNDHSQPQTKTFPRQLPL